jgi:uncharacterized protein (TIGR03790 family)
MVLKSRMPIACCCRDLLREGKEGRQRHSRSIALRATVLLLFALMLQDAIAGGSGLNVVVVVNQESPNSVELGNFYCEQRQVPPENLLRISWTGGNTLWTSNDFYTLLEAPLLEMLTTRGLTSQIDYVVLSMDIPFQTRRGNTLNSTTSALFYGLKELVGFGWYAITNSYSGSEGVFRLSRPATAPRHSFLTTMMTGRTLESARLLVLQGLRGDYYRPNLPVILAKSSDPLRNFRYQAFDDAIFNTLLCHGSIARTNADSLGGQTNLPGYQTGLARLDLQTGTFAPGAIADSLTSFGGVIFGANDHTSLLDFIEAGASGSYGTIAEPSPSLEKFPDPRDYFCQARGFNLAECYYQSIADPHEGLIVGEPLSAPYSYPAAGRWTSPAVNAVLGGIVPLEAIFSARVADRTVGRIDFFFDGRFLATATNSPPAAGNTATLIVNGYPVKRSVPANATLASLAHDLAEAVNAADASCGLQVRATNFGDRIQLHSTAADRAPFFALSNFRSNDFPKYYRTAYLAEAAPTLTAVGASGNGGFHLQLESPPNTTCVVEATSDWHNWVPVATNSGGGIAQLFDSGATNYASRFYRLAWQTAELRPRLALLSRPGSEGLLLRINQPTNLPYMVQTSTNLTDWLTVLTNEPGTSMEFPAPDATASPSRFYRTITLLQDPAPPAATFVGQTADGIDILRVDDPLRPCVVLSSSNLVHWTPVFTNLIVGTPTLRSETAKGRAGYLSTFLSASGASFLKTTAFGIQPCSVEGTLQVGTWLGISVTLTNGSRVQVTVTNQSSDTVAFHLVQELARVVNSLPRLLGPEGLVMEDLAEGWFGSASFNLRARSQGIEAAALAINFEASPDLVLAPETGDFALKHNLADLQPRAHALVRSGQVSLPGQFYWDTRLVPDGFHELTAVGYEGSHVQTQKRVSLPVEVRNSELRADLDLPGLSGSNPVHLPVTIQVTANTNTITSIQLYSTGGLLRVSTNQSSTEFQVPGTELGVGLHPFFALLETADGLRYRTQVRHLRLTNP